MKTLLVFVAVLFGQLSLASTSCYRYELHDTPEMSAVPTLEVQTWCYQDVKSPIGAKLIFNADAVRPELAALVTADGIATHGSMIKGIVTAHKVLVSQFNPLPVPLEEPQSLAPLSGSEAQVDQKAVNNVIRFLLSSRDDAPSIAVQEGVSTAAVPQQNLPWRGYWWSYRLNLLAGGYYSPLAKYDRYVLARTGNFPGVQSWENTYHAYKGIDWEGHCNGWAASAVLRAEPTTDKIFPQTNLVFSVADQKGILAEEDYCAAVAFYGHRNSGQYGDDPSDIYPADFHKVITYYIGQLGKVVAIDYMSSPAVDNNLVSGYSMTVTRQSADTFYVEATLTFHQYDSSPYIAPGIAPVYYRTYQYYLTVDANGIPVGGSWVSANPDFLWVPLSPLDCSANNPRMSQQFTSEILGLPPITQ